MNVNNDDIILVVNPISKYYYRQAYIIKQGHSILINKIFSTSQLAYETAVTNAEKRNHYQNVDTINNIIKRLMEKK